MATVFIKRQKTIDEKMKIAEPIEAILNLMTIEVESKKIEEEWEEEDRKKKMKRTWSNW